MKALGAERRTRGGSRMNRAPHGGLVGANSKEVLRGSLTQAGRERDFLPWRGKRNVGDTVWLKMRGEGREVVSSSHHVLDAVPCRDSLR